MRNEEKLLNAVLSIAIVGPTLENVKMLRSKPYKWGEEC